MSEFIQLKLTKDDFIYSFEIGQFFASNAGKRFLEDLSVAREMAFAKLKKSYGEEMNRAIGIIEGLDIARSLPVRIVDEAEKQSGARNELSEAEKEVEQVLGGVLDA